MRVTSNSPTVTVGGGGITASIQSASATSISVTLNISAEASGGNHAITVTANEQPSNAVDFYVQIPTKLERKSISDLEDQEDGCGVVRHLSYQVLIRTAIQSRWVAPFRRPSSASAACHQLYRHRLQIKEQLSTVSFRTTWATLSPVAHRLSRQLSISFLRFISTRRDTHGRLVVKTPSAWDAPAPASSSLILLLLRSRR